MNWLTPTSQTHWSDFESILLQYLETSQKPEIFCDFCEKIDVKSAKTKVLVYQVYRPDGWCYIKPIFVISTLLKHLTGNIQYLGQWDSSFAQAMMIISDWASDGSKLRSDHAES